MVFRPDVLSAFQTLDIDIEADFATATKAYKRLALLHHPDRNHGDSGATQRFQQVPLFSQVYDYHRIVSHSNLQIGAAWNICQRHFDNPSWSHVPESSSRGFSFDDDDIPLDEDDLYEFYM
jgi:hypothetical protein